MYMYTVALFCVEQTVSEHTVLLWLIVHFAFQYLLCFVHGREKEQSK